LPPEIPKLKVFISWAGDRANVIATGFHDFLPDVVNAVQPFMSGANIDKGTRWSDALNSSLLESTCAIVCLTEESMRSVWVAFETGAISRAAGGTEGARSRIWTYLSGLETTSLQLTPFAEYQATSATQDETLRLVRSINALSPDPVSTESLKRRFDAVFWPHFAKVLEKAQAATNPPNLGPKEAQHQNLLPIGRERDDDLLSEILRTLRSVQREVRRGSVQPLMQTSDASEFALQSFRDRLQKVAGVQGWRMSIGPDDVIEVSLNDKRPARIKRRGLERLVALDDRSFSEWVAQVAELKGATDKQSLDGEVIVTDN
jgi:hypothetical protein